MAENLKAKQRMDLAFAALISDDDAAVLTALTRIEEHGDARAIRPMLDALTRSPKPQVEQRISSLLYQVKAEGAVPALLEALNDPALRTVRKTALAAFWNAGLDARDHLGRFIQIAIEGDAQECFECLTVIENQEVWPEKAARLGLATLRSAATAEQDAYKATMLNDMVSNLERRLGTSSPEE